MPVRAFRSITRMTVERMDHVGVIVEDLAEAVAFFVDLGLEVEGEAEIEGKVVDRLLALEGVQTRIAMLRTPDGCGGIELTEFRRPAMVRADELAGSNASGLRHLAFAVDDIEGTLARLQARGAELIGELAQYDNSYRLCYLRGPAGIIVELAEKVSAES